MHHIELKRMDTFASDWQDLKPTHTINFSDHMNEMRPINGRKRGLCVDSQALELGFLLIIFKHLLFKESTHPCWLGCSGKSLPE
jgi:hypothetical protein